MQAFPYPFRKALTVLFILAMAMPMLGNIPAPATVGADTSSRAGIYGCPGSMPPPEVNGIHYGDWKISCDVKVISTDVQIQGNILLTFGGSLYIKNVSTIEMVSSPFSTGPYVLSVESMTTLKVEKSVLKVDKLIASTYADVFITTSTVRSRGGISSIGGLFTVSQSSVSVFADSYGISTKAELNVSPEAGFIDQSTILVQGANGNVGNDTTPPQDGGDADLRIIGPVVKNSTIFINGGTGGKGWDSSRGAGQAGGRGGKAQADLMVDDLDSLTMYVNGGLGGPGGSGVSYMMDQPGGQGAHGGLGGDATVTELSHGGNITSCELSIKAGPGGPGGDGGGTKGAQGGNGGPGAAGGKANLSIEAPTMVVYNNNITVQGGTGGPGGLYGRDNDDIMNGAAGTGAEGGEALFDLHIYKDLQVLSSDLRSWGGVGASGGAGWTYGADGGHGGPSKLMIFAGGNISINAKAPPGAGSGSGLPSSKIAPQLSSEGGNGGAGGLYGMGSAGSEQYMGHAGVSGDGTVSLESLGLIDILRAKFHAAPGRTAQGRLPESGSRSGTKHLLVSAARYTVTDSSSDVTFEGLKGQGLGILKNTTVTGDASANVWTSEPNATVEVWWSLKVNFTPMLVDQSAEVYLSNDPAGLDRVSTCILQGPWDRCTISIKGEIVTSKGRDILNYTVTGLTDDNVAATPVTFFVSGNKEITLQPAGDFYAPHVNITYPEDGWTVTVKELATGVVTFRGMSWLDQRDPPSSIKDVQIELLNWKTGKAFTFDYKSGVNLTKVSSSMMAWSFDINLKVKDGYEPKWPSGPYRLCARSSDGVLWSDSKDPRRGGSSVCVQIIIQQEDTKVPVMEIPATFPSQLTVKIPYDGNYAEAIFDTKAISDLGASGTYYSFLWDFDSDGKTDWTYIATEGSYPPPARFVYTKPGIFSARLSITDINGDVSSIDTQVNVQKEAKPVSKTYSPSIPLFCLPALIIFLIMLCMLYLATIYHEGFRFKVLTKVMVPLNKKLGRPVDDQDSLERQITEYVREKPGRFFGTVQKDLELNGTTLAREVLRLEDEGYLVYKPDGKFIRLISTRQKKEAPKKGLRPHQKAILKALIRHPWQTPVELSEEIRRTVSFTVRQLGKLQARGLVVMTQDPEEGPLYKVTPPAKKAPSAPIKAPKPTAPEKKVPVPETKAPVTKDEPVQKRGPRNL